jgi:cellulose biosynthesis protein BcsQ
MPVIAVVNRKGGSGKSTLAAHLAAWCAHSGNSVMLGDVDRQQSTRSWLRRRGEDLPTIAPWAVDQNILRVPTGMTHVVLDTPGGMHGFDLARMVMFADVVLMPVCSSSFDRESAAACHAELMTLPRIASGRCKLACIGMRIDSRTNSAQVMQDWAASLGIPFLGVLRETQLYVQCLERGMTLFDLPDQNAEIDLLQWQPILDWLNFQFSAVQVKPAPAPLGRSTVPNRFDSFQAERPPIEPKPLFGSQRATPAPAPRAPSRVASTVLQHKSSLFGSGNTAVRTAQAAAPESPPIPSFLKLVKF